jgi:hypothetical protein
MKHTIPPRSEEMATGNTASQPQQHATSGESIISPIPDFGLFSIERMSL